MRFWKWLVSMPNAELDELDKKRAELKAHEAEMDQRLSAVLSSLEQREFMVGLKERSLGCTRPDCLRYKLNEHLTGQSEDVNY